jgi:hypothetical protein
MRVFRRMILLVAVVFMVVSLPGVVPGVDVEEQEFVCFPFICP